jgi:phosphatidylethanolamine-binding protein (PEBP) family uncharacterized protein
VPTDGAPPVRGTYATRCGTKVTGGNGRRSSSRWPADLPLPAGTKSFAFTINDVDAPVAGGFHHWVVHITYEQLLATIAPDVTGATSLVGKFRLPLHS